MQGIPVNALHTQVLQQFQQAGRAAERAQRPHGGNVLGACQRLSDGNGPHVRLVVILRRFQAVRTPVRGRNIRQNGSRIRTQGECLSIHERFQGGPGGARHGCSIQKPPLRMLSVRGTNQAENVSRSVFHHHHGSLGHMVILKVGQLPPYDFLNSALQGGIQRGMNFPGPEGSEKGGRHVGSQGLTALFRSGTEQGFLQGAVQHLHRKYAFLLHSAENAVPAFQGPVRVVEGIQTRRPLGQTRQQGTFRQGKMVHIPSKVKTGRSRRPAAQIAVIQTIEVSLQNLLFAHGHFQTPGLKKFPHF